MPRLAVVFAILVAATALEVGGDALLRLAATATPQARPALYVAGAAALVAYGVVLVRAPVDFGRLLGVYVALFFLAAQLVDALVFKATPTPAVLVGGALIVAGGAIVASARA